VVADVGRVSDDSIEGFTRRRRILIEEVPLEHGRIWSGALSADSGFWIELVTEHLVVSHDSAQTLKPGDDSLEEHGFAARRFQDAVASTSGCPMGKVTRELRRRMVRAKLLLSRRSGGYHETTFRSY
jgi:hypothetical protein